MRLALSVVLLSGLLPAQALSAEEPQNLLTWNGWQPWNAEYIRQLSITPTKISFWPYFRTWPLEKRACGIEQQVQIPEDGTYQLRFKGVGGQTGWFNGSWNIQGQTHYFPAHEQQRTWTFQLKAGQAVLRLQTDTSDLYDLWFMDPPELWRSLEPTVDIYFLSYGPSTAVFTTSGHVLLIALQSQRPVAVPGFAHGLELGAGFFVVASTGSPPLKAGVLTYGVTWPEFYLQAVSLGSAPGFGQVLRAKPFQF